MTIYASCSHQINDIDDCTPLFILEYNREFEPVLTAGDFCNDCAKRMLSEPYVWDDFEKAQDEWEKM